MLNFLRDKKNANDANDANFRESLIRGHPLHSRHSRSINPKYYFYVFLCIFD
jgi:hypothetical protein